MSSIMSSVVSAVKNCRYKKKIAVVIAAAIVEEDDDLREQIESKVSSYIASVVKTKTGLQLDENSPLSDSSLSSAVTQATGIPISSLSSIREDFETFAVEKINATTGLELTDISSEAAIKKDIAAYATARFNAASGLGISDITDIEAVKSAVKANAESRYRELLNDAINKSVEKLKGKYNDVKALIAIAIRKKIDQKISIKIARLQVASDNVLSAYAKTGGGAARMVQIERRKAQMREASRRFRAAHPKSTTYMPI